MISLGLSHAEASDGRQPPGEVIRALGEAAAWCTLHPFGTDKLRCSLLDPHTSFSVPTLNELGIDAFVKAKREGYKQAVESIQRKRSEWLREAKARPFEPTEAQSLGRLLLYEGMETVSDGAAEASSHSFYDVEDAPPWDTWFGTKTARSSAGSQMLSSRMLKPGSTQILLTASTGRTGRHSDHWSTDDRR